MKGKETHTTRTRLFFEKAPQKTLFVKSIIVLRRAFLKENRASFACVSGKIMHYKKNDKMDYIQTDETSLAVFDPESGDTHLFDETGIDILTCLDEACGLDALLVKLCKIYDAEPDDIRADVEEFLADTIEKKVVLIV